MNDFLMIIIQSSILILALLLVRKLFMGKINPILQYSLWGIVALRLFVPINIESAFSIFNTIKPQTIEKAVAPAIFRAVQSGTVQNIPTAPSAPIETISNAINSADPVTNSISTTQVLIAILFAVWIVGMAVMLIYTLIVNLKFYSYVKKNGLKQNGYTICPNITSPCLMGRMIVLNNKAADNERAKEYALLHEQTHLKHLDNVWAAFRTLACIIYWFNPLVWIAAAVCRKDQELACDYAVIKQIGEENRKEYGQVLISLIRKNKTLPALTTAMANNKKDIKQRLKLIANRPKMLKITAVVLALVIVAVSVIACTGAITPNVKNNTLIPLNGEELATGEMSFQYAGDLGYAELATYFYENGMTNDHPTISKFRAESGKLNLTIKSSINTENNNYTIEIPSVNGIYSSPDGMGNGIVGGADRVNGVDSFHFQGLPLSDGYSIVGLGKETEVKSGERIPLWCTFYENDGSYATHYDTDLLAEKLGHIEEYEWAVVVWVTFYDEPTISDVEPVNERQEPDLPTAVGSDIEINNNILASLPEAKEITYSVEGEKETATLEKVVYEDIFAMYYDAENIEYNTFDESDMKGLMFILKDSLNNNTPSPVISISYMDGESIESYMDSNKSVKSRSETLGGYEFAVFDEFSPKLNSIQYTTYLKDIKNGCLRIALTFNEEWQEGWTPRFISMLDTIVLN